MRLASVRVRGFKGLAGFAADLQGLAEAPLAEAAVVGATGSGKTSVLQAVSWALATAAGRARGPEELRWPGLADAPSLLGPGGEVEVVVAVDEADRALCRRLARRAPAPAGAEAPEAPPPPERMTVRLTRDGMETDPPFEASAAWATVGERFLWFPAERRPARRDLATLQGERGDGAALREAFLRVLPGVPLPAPGLGIDPLSAGQRAVLSVLGQLLRHGSPSGDVVLLDTPELGLDVAAQQALVREVSAQVAPGQLVVATASDAVGDLLPREACFVVAGTAVAAAGPVGRREAPA